MWPAIIGAGVGVGGDLLGGYLSDRASDKAIKAMQEAMRQMNARIDASIGEISGLTDEYIQELETLDASFDPFDMSRSYDSFYEEVIVPMERDYAEYIDPAVHSAYSGGMTGEEGAHSGAAKEAQARSRRDLSARKSDATAKERDTNISRNMYMDERARSIAKDKLSAATMAPEMRIGAAQGAFDAQSGIISARLDKDMNRAGMFAGLFGSAAKGIDVGTSLADYFKKQNSPANPFGIEADGANPERGD